jgi:FAD/FMN-containing dehydrogenase
MTKAVEEVYSVLRQRFKGALLRPDDDEFERARSIWNGMVTSTPGLIASCTDVTDVQLAVRAAAQAAALTAVRCGGHSLAGSSTSPVCAR